MVLPAHPDMHEEKLPQLASDSQALYADAHVPLSAVPSQLAHVVVLFWHSPPEHVPPSHELPHVPQSVLDVERYWQPSEHIV